MQEPSSSSFARKYGLWKERLLDLTARNRLLNFRSTRVSTIQISSPGSADLYDRLAVREKSLTFPLYQGKTVVSLVDEDDDDKGSMADAPYKVLPGDIETTKIPPDLEKSLFRLAALARSSKEERGINTLYLALGMLEYQPQIGAGVQKSPLFLVPVDLKREDRLHPYVLSPFDEDAEVNPTLVYMLKRDFDFAIPTPIGQRPAARSRSRRAAPGDEEAIVTADSVRAFFKDVERAVSKMGWKVSDEAWLGQFHFKKLAMYKDLEEHEPGAAENDRVAAIAGLSDFSNNVDVGTPESFDLVPPSEVFTVLDADRTQLEALLRARAGQSLIIVGPPGTGKSQTIANMIAQFLYERKKVLFVSEKMAALSVVYRRLEEVGLGPFCLEIHSDKANKRDTLKRIQRATNVSAQEVSRQARGQFAALLGLRRELNEYARVLHEPVLNGATAFETHGDLATLHDIPDVVAPIQVDAQSLTQEKEAELLRLARRLAQMPDMLARYIEHPWYGCRIKEWTLAGQTDVRAHLERLREMLDHSASANSNVATFMVVPPPECIDDLEPLLDFTRLFSESPSPPVSWFLNPELSLTGLDQRAQEMAKEQGTHRALRAELLRSYSPGVLDAASAEVAESFNPSLIGAFRAQDGQRNQLKLSSELLLNSLMEASDALEQASGAGTMLSELLHEAYPRDVREYRRLSQIAELVSANPRPSPEWFEIGSLSALMEHVRDCAAKSARLGVVKGEISEDYKDEIFILALTDWRSDFESRYSSPLRILKSEYRRRMSRLKSLNRRMAKPKFEEALRIVRLGAEASEIESWFAMQRGHDSMAFGFHYSGLTTDWTLVLQHLQTVRRLIELGGGTTLPDGVRTVTVNGGPATGEAGRLGRIVAASVQRVETSLGSRAETVTVSALLVMGTDLDSQPLAGLKSRLVNRVSEIQRFIVAERTMRGFLRTEAERTAEDMAGDSASAVEVKRLEVELEVSRDALTEAYGRLFSGVDTDWDAVTKAIDWTARFDERRIALRYGEDCLKAACEADRVSRVNDAVQRLDELALAIEIETKFLHSIFDRQASASGGLPFERTGFMGALGWLDRRIARIGELSDWVQFQSLREECDRSGLADFVAEVLRKRIGPDILELALKKRLRVLQLDEIYRQRPRLGSFQWRDQEELVQSFKDLDRRLMRTFAQMVRASIIERQPNLRGTGAGQVGFLNRELTKQKRHKPLRELFSQAGNVVLDIMPCLLMSPLSVATYLPKDSVRFDVVIFDEASQMPAEEAIGSVLRGRQLIVAGDPNQLPPSRFFERSLEGTESGLEDEDVDPLESVLQDCDAASMQPSALQWHYRSRHESLIAFSNAEFYENSLVIYPSPMSPPPDGVGVSFSFVENAIYGKGTNRDEARRVAELIERHLDRWGSQRSLGVIALSVVQADVVMEEVERLLLSRPDLETYIRSETEEPFFVKPLENVQGDERDSIIITVGYGKDGEGILSHNFGPINNDGGERRLNVAVTRAKWHLTLVSSIQASDIDESRVSRRGPKVLKRYLAFAKDGRLPPDTSGPSGVWDSPFEQAVGEVLSRNGLEVDRNVGVSKYRIDLGIKNPRHPGTYLLGVECDGATYHRSIVARDRDRLRQQVLENLGWKIHRIWSTDWIRDQRGAVQRVLDRVTELQEEGSGASGSQDPGRTPNASASDDSDDPEQILPDAPVAVPLTFSPDETVPIYTETPTPRFSPDDFYSGDTSRIRDGVILVVDTEGPVHKDIVVVRVARLFGLSRTGSTIDDETRRQIKGAVNLKRIAERGSFLWPLGLAEIAPRQPAPGFKPRNAEYIPPEEIGAAILAIVKIARAIKEEELVPEAARLLGIMKAGKNVKAAFKETVEGLLASEKLAERGEFLVLNDTAPSSKPLVTSQGAQSIPEGAQQLVQRHSLRVIDMRPKGGSLWILAGPEHSAALEPLGFKFVAKGAHSTNYRSAWYLTTR